MPKGGYSSFWPSQRATGVSPQNGGGGGGGGATIGSSDDVLRGGGGGGGDESGSADFDATGGGGGGHGAKSQRKARIHYSCDPCHVRKQKCSREMPCSNCLARNVPEQCKYSMGNPSTAARASSSSAAASPNANARSSTTQDVRERLDVQRGEFEDLRSIVQEGFAEVLHAIRTNRGGDGGGVGNGVFAHSSIKSSSVLGKRKDMATSAKEDEDEDQDELVHLPSVPATSRSGNRLLDMLSVHNATNIFDVSRSIDARSSIDQTMFEVSMRGLQGNGPLSQSLLTCLPPDDQLQQMYARFKDDFTCTRSTLAPESILRCVAKIPVMRKRGFITTDEVSSFAVAAALCSQAVLRTDRADVPAHELTALYRQARAMVFASIKALYTSDVLGRMDKEMCLAQILAARFLLMDRRLNEAFMCTGSAVRCAQGLGLHKLDTTSTTHKEAWEIEEERLLWCALRFDERSYGLMLERPSCIDDRICQTTPPPPSTTLTFADAEAVRFRFELATLQGRMSLLLQSGGAKGVNVREVLALDEEMVAFRQRVPAGDLRVVSTFLQLSVIHLHTLQTRLALLRPFFLRKVPMHASDRVRRRHAACRQKCVEAACEDASLREKIVLEVGTLFTHAQVPGVIRRLIRTPKWFTPLVICGAYLLTTQSDGDAKYTTSSNDANKERQLMQQARQHLHTFVELAEDRQRREGQRDATLDREVGIMRMFLEKSSEKAVARLKSEGRLWKNDSMHPTTTIASNSANYSTPISSSNPAANGMYDSNVPQHYDDTTNVYASSNGGGAFSNKPSGDDLQAILDAWFQSDSQVSLVGDVSSVFDTTALHSAAINTTTLNTTGLSTNGTSLPVMNAISNNGNFSSSSLEGHYANGEIGGGVGVGGATHPDGGEFWQNFINMLSSQSSHVY